MTRLAVLADIHGNPFALDAVISDLEDQEVDEVIVAGDLVGRGPRGSEVIRRIRDRGWACVRGNHEDYLLSFFHGEIPDAWRVDEEWAASRFMAADLTADDATFLDSLPFTLSPDADPSIEIFHGSPTSHSEGIGAWTPEDLLHTHLDSIEGDTLVCAHTHRPLLYTNDTGTIVNVGSVGLPFNGDWRAQYALFTGDPDHWEITFRQVSYDRDAFLRLYETSGFLAEGGVTARLLYQEVRHARPALVPFLKWTKHTGTAPTSDALPAFFEVFDPQRSLADFMRLLRE